MPTPSAPAAGGSASRAGPASRAGAAWRARAATWRARRTSSFSFAPTKKPKRRLERAQRLRGERLELARQAADHADQATTGRRQRFAQGHHDHMVQTFLASDRAFRGLDEEERERLASQCDVEEFMRGQQVLHRTIGKPFFVVTLGTVERTRRNGNPHAVHPGGIFQDLQHGTIAASDKVVCLVVTEACVERGSELLKEVFRRGALKTMVGASLGPGWFDQLDDAQQDAFTGALECRDFAAGDLLMRFGSPPVFLLVVQGELAVVAGEKQMPAVKRTLQNPQDLRPLAKEVLDRGMSFGSKQILEDLPLEDSVFGLQSGRIFSVGQARLLALLGEPLGEVVKKSELRKVLSEIFLFHHLEEEQIKDVLHSLKSRSYKAGSAILREGEAAEHFYLIQAGSVSVTIRGRKVRTLGCWDYFGERGLIREEERSATCWAESACVCLTLDARAFRAMVPGVRRVFEDRMFLQDMPCGIAGLRSTAVVGRGSMSVLRRVFAPGEDGAPLALKCVRKGDVAARERAALLLEREVHLHNHHPCIVHFVKTLQDAQHVYFLMEFMPGGDLFQAMRSIGKLSRPQAQYYVASITLGLDYLHGHSFVHRDLRPEHVLLDADGHAVLAGFGGCCRCAERPGERSTAGPMKAKAEQAKGCEKPRAQTLVGAPEYLAPEVILGGSYTVAADWWALGVIMHELVAGPLPFRSSGGARKSRVGSARRASRQLAGLHALFREICTQPLELPKGLEDDAAASLTSGLLERAPELRIGSSARGAEEVKEHWYFGNFSWKDLLARQMDPPWAPYDLGQQAWEVGEGGRPVVEVCRGDAVVGCVPSSHDWAAAF